MTAPELLADLTRRGIKLKANGARLRFHPRSAVTPALADLMTTHKAELLRLLRPDKAWLRGEWVRRPDASGRMGIERAELSDDERWWATSNCWPDDEPQPPPTIRMDSQDDSERGNRHTTAARLPQHLAPYRV